jgi:hypothetical protein
MLLGQCDQFASPMLHNPTGGLTLASDGVQNTGSDATICDRHTPKYFGNRTPANPNPNPKRLPAQPQSPAAPFAPAAPSTARVRVLAGFRARLRGDGTDGTRCGRGALVFWRRLLQNGPPVQPLLFPRGKSATWQLLDRVSLPLSRAAPPVIAPKGVPVLLECRSQAHLFPPTPAQKRSDRICMFRSRCL